MAKMYAYEKALEGFRAPAKCEPIMQSGHTNRGKEESRSQQHKTPSAIQQKADASSWASRPAEDPPSCAPGEGVTTNTGRLVGASAADEGKGVRPSSWSDPNSIPNFTPNQSPSLNSPGGWSTLPNARGAGLSLGSSPFSSYNQGGQAGWALQGHSTPQVHQVPQETGASSWSRTSRSSVDRSRAQGQGVTTNTGRLVRASAVDKGKGVLPSSWVDLNNIPNFTPNQSPGSWNSPGGWPTLPSAQGYWQPHGYWHGEGVPVPPPGMPHQLGAVQSSVHDCAGRPRHQVGIAGGLI